MTSLRRRLVLVSSAALIAAAALSGCSSPDVAEQEDAPSPAASSATSPSAAPEATAAPTAAAGSDTAALCEANRVAAAAKAGTVGEDLEAVTAQAATIRGMLPLQGVGAEVSAGAEVFAAAAEETAAILAEFPVDSLVSDVGLDPRFTESDAVANAASDPDYQAFVLWVMETCE